MIYIILFFLNILTFFLIPLNNHYFYFFCAVSIIWYLLENYMKLKVKPDLTFKNKDFLYQTEVLRPPYSFSKRLVLSVQLNADQQTLNALKHLNSVKISNYYWLKKVLNWSLLASIIFAQYLLIIAIKTIEYSLHGILFFSIDNNKMDSFIKFFRKIIELVKNLVVILDCYCEDFEDEIAERKVNYFSKRSSKGILTTNNLFNS